VAIYDDRLEITSSGSLHFGLTPEKLFAPHESLPWNPLIADAFYRRGIIERWGRGTLKIAELAAEAGLPAPEIEDGGGGVTVRFRPRVSPNPLRISVSFSPPNAVSLNEQQQAILRLLEESDRPLALREIHARFPVTTSVRQVKRTLSRLRELGLVVPTGHGVSARWTRATK